MGETRRCGTAGERARAAEELLGADRRGRGGIERDGVEGPPERKEWDGGRSWGVRPRRDPVITGSEEGALPAG